MKNKNLHLLRRYIREAIDLGKVEFSSERVDDVDKSEPDTPEEARLYAELMMRVKKGRALNQETANTILALLDSKHGQAPGGSGFFSEPPPNQPLYRGQDFNLEWLRKHVNQSDITRLPRLSDPDPDPDNDTTLARGRAALSNMMSKGKLVNLATPYTFNPLRGWSKDSAAAIRFAAEYAVGGDTYAQSNAPKQGVAVVLVARGSTSNSRFLDMSTNMYKTKIGIPFSHEAECINLQPVDIHQAAIFVYDNMAKL